MAKTYMASTPCMFARLLGLALVFVSLQGCLVNDNAGSDKAPPNEQLPDADKPNAAERLFFLDVPTLVSIELNGYSDYEVRAHRLRVLRTSSELVLYTAMRLEGISNDYHATEDFLRSLVILQSVDFQRYQLVALHLQSSEQHQTFQLESELEVYADQLWLNLTISDSTDQATAGSTDRLVYLKTPRSSLPVYLNANGKTVNPEELDPEVTDPEVTDPEVTDPEVTDPEVTDPEVIDPEVTDPEVTDPI